MKAIVRMRIAAAAVWLNALWVAGIVVCIAPGCSRQNDNYIVTGKVTYDGQPLSQGQIVFEPRAAGKMSVAQIHEGTYSLPAGFGLSPGEYTVRITSDRPTGQKVKPAVYSEDQTPTNVYEQFLPAKYNQNSELKITVSPESVTGHDFALTSL
jgi:hypothetical protein